MLYSQKVVQFSEEQDWTLTITADQTGPLRKQIEALAESAWQTDPEDTSLSYGEVWYQPVKWGYPYRYSVRREKKPDRSGQSGLFKVMSY